MIHYHGTPCGGKRQDVAAFLAGRHALIPFPRPEDLPIAAEVCQSFVIDNGAYTIWKSGNGSVDVKTYLEFCNEWTRHPACDWCIIPDVIDGTEADNLSAIREWKNAATAKVCEQSVPVWHYHESIRFLRHLATNFRVVALGSSGEWPTPGTDGWWQRTREAIGAISDEQGRPVCKLHGLRMLNPEIFSRLPLASADSTNAVRNSSNYSRFGNYLPPTAAQRMAVIANRIESSQAAPALCKKELEADLWTLQV